MLKVWSF